MLRLLTVQRDGRQSLKNTREDVALCSGMASGGRYCCAAGCVGRIPQHDMADAVRSLAVIDIARSCLLLVPASAAYSVVADIERYPDFLPACESVKVLSREQDCPNADCLSAERIGVERIDAEVVASKAGANFTFVTRNTGASSQSKHAS